MRPARRSAGDAVFFDFVGAVREPPVLKGRQSKPWIPAFAGMTGFRGGARRRGNPRRRLDVVPCQIEGAPGLVFRRHSGEGRNPEPGRAAANGRSRPIHARVHGFVGAAPPRGRPTIREPPVLTGRRSKPWIPAFAGMTAGAARGGGEILAAVSMLLPVGSKGRRGWPFAGMTAGAEIEPAGVSMKKPGAGTISRVPAPGVNPSGVPRP